MKRALKFAIGLFSFLIVNLLFFALAVADLTIERGFETAFYITFTMLIIQGIGLYLLLTNRP